MKKVIKKIRELFSYYVIFRGNRIKFLRSQGVKIGKHCQILNRPINYGSEPWLIEVGDKVTITYGVFLLTHDAASRLFRETLPNSSIFGNRFGSIKIKDNCFVGINSIILPGVKIGPNSIVGAGSVVNKDVPPNTVVAGVPARFICSLNEYVEKYKEKMVPIKSENRDDLRVELTKYFWEEER